MLYLARKVEEAWGELHLDLIAMTEAAKANCPPDKRELLTATITQLHRNFGLLKVNAQLDTVTIAVLRGFMLSALAIQVCGLHVRPEEAAAGDKASKPPPGVKVGSSGGK